MSSRAQREFRRAGKPAPEPRADEGVRWYGKLGLILLTVVLLSLSFAPFAQFYLAWVGLVPWLMLVRSTRSQWAAFLWGWLAGALFFTANMWWLVYVTGPGMVALMVVLGLYWGMAAVLIRGARLLVAGDDDRGAVDDASGPGTGGRGAFVYSLTSTPLARVLLIPAVWVALEWVRGNWPLNGLPWLFLGHGQTPVLAMCQVADVLGVYGISFWVVAVNTLVALFILDRLKGARLAPAAIAVGSVLALVLAYGVFRMSQADALTPGPLVMVVQSNYPQSNTGEKGASQQELVDYHVTRTAQALEATPGVDLVVWSETMMPELNRAARAMARGLETRGHRDYGRFLDETHARLQELARENKAALLAGAIYHDEQALPDPAAPEGIKVLQDRRNSAFFYDRSGHMSDDAADRYDKIHIVPFGEYLPFKDAIPILYKFILSLSPYDEGYFLTPGSETEMRVFRLDAQPPAGAAPGENPATAPATAAVAPTTGPADAPASARRLRWRFVTPICFEDIDPLLVGKMFREKRGGVTGKAADFIVNITNDGWFKANQMPQHLQAARFRSIENRAPTARSVNTGISGFVDSFGRTYGLVPAGREGTSVQRLQLDSRVTLYTRWGDVFASLCAVVTIGVIGLSVVRWWTVGRRMAAGAIG